MNSLDKIRKEILDAKETRWKKQLAFIDKYHFPIIGFKFNIPSWPKTSRIIEVAWEKSLNDFLLFLQKKRVDFLLLEKDKTVLGPEAFIRIDLKAKQAKEITIDFEESFEIGRLLDIDIIDIDKKPIEREIKRKCYICDDIAFNCMRANRHAPEEAREFFDRILAEKIKEYK